MDRRYGLFDGFEAYRTPSEQDFSRVLKNGLVVLDANVLIDLYRMSARVRADMLTVLETVSTQLWVPHQAVLEFWRGRQGEELMSYHTKKADAAKKGVDKALAQAAGALGEWANSVHVSDASEITLPLQEKLDEAGAAFAKMKSIFDERAAADSVAGIRNTNSDPVIRALESILQGRVGAPYSQERRAEEIVRAKERAENEVPPGIEDFKKKDDPELAAGDYLVWRQMLDEAQVRKLDVLFVTRDTKADWWHYLPGEAGITRIPRIDLIDEARSVAGCRLYMAEPSAFMQHVSRSFGLGKKVDSNSVAALRQLESAEAAAATPSSAEKSKYRLAQIPGGRTTDYVEAVWLMAQLVEENSNLAACISRFMEEFPTVTLFPEARRRLMNLYSLGLASVRDGEIFLTPNGEQFAANRDADLLTRLFIDRIEGAAEARNLVRSGISVSDVRELLVEHPIELNTTQADLVVRWLVKLGLASN